jgi:hypothetical protein
MERIQQIEELIRQIESSADPGTRSRVHSLMEAVLEYHGAGFARTLEIIRESGPGAEAVVRELGRDPLVASLLLLYSLHPEDFEARVRRAVDGLPGVQFLDASDGVARLRAISSVAVSREVVEQAIYSAAPETIEIEIEGLQTLSPSFVPLEALLDQS